MTAKPGPQSSPIPSRTSSRPPCPAHGLATGPDGRCALCKREALGSYRPPRAEPSSASRVMTALIGVAAAASVGVALAFSLGGIELGPPRAAAPSDQYATPPPAPRPRGYGPEEAQPPRTQQAAAPAAAPSAVAEAAASPASDARAMAEQERKLKEELERDRQRRESINADIEQRARKRARGGVSVVMYSTTWCGVCTKARGYMTDQGIPFVEHDVEESPSARAIYQRLNPKGGVPTIDVDGEVLIGFSGSTLERMIEAAAKKRVR